MLYLQKICFPAIFLLLSHTLYTLPPAQAEEIATSALPRQASIYRDPYGVPHIYAAREEDGFYALGYARAEDRLEQLLLYYLIVSGQLAEVFGPGPLNAATISPRLAGYANSAIIKDTIASDKYVRQARFLTVARENFSRLSPQVQADLNAYLAGIERYMRDHPQKVPNWAPKLEPAFAMAADAYQTWSYAISSARTLCLPPKPETTAISPLDPQQLIQAAAGSNAWAVAPSKTKDGVTIHLSDSHSSVLQFGSIFYNWRIKAGKYDFLGFGDAASPFAMFGHSPYFAWGWTDYGNRLSDCYRVQTSAENPRQYLYDGQLMEMYVEPYIIRVKGGPDITGEFEYTHHNNLLSAVVRREQNVSYVISTPYMDQAGLALEQYRDMALSRNFAEFEQAMRRLALFPDNLVVAGADGTIFYIKTGREPIRPDNGDGTKILDGNSSATAWLGLYSLDQLMQIRNPPEGYLVNNNVSPEHVLPNGPIRKENYPASFVINDHVTKRQRRAIEVLSHKKHLTLKDALNLVMDNKVQDSDKWGPAISLAAKSAPMANTTASFRKFLRHLSRFDGHFIKSSKAALYHLETRHALLMHCPDSVDEISDKIEAGAALSLVQNHDLMKAALVAHDNIREKFGTIDVRYGDVHQIMRGSQALPSSGTSFIAGYGRKYHSSRNHPLLNKRVVVVDSLKQMNFDFVNTDSQGRRPFIGGQRIPFLTVFSNPVQSFSLMAYGISDDPASPHYADQMDLMSNDQMKSTFFNWSELQSNIQNTITLDIDE